MHEFCLLIDVYAYVETFVQLIFLFKQLHIIKDAIIVVIFLCVLRYLHLIIANNLPTIMCKSWHVAVGAVSKRYSEDYLTRVQKYISIKLLQNGQFFISSQLVVSLLPTFNLSLSWSLCFEDTLIISTSVIFHVVLRTETQMIDTY